MMYMLLDISGFELIWAFGFFVIRVSLGYLGISSFELKEIF